MFDYDSAADGRLAFYVNGKFGNKWRLTASADTREGPLEDLFTNFMSKSPDALFRRIDPDYHYPTFGDDGTVEETAPTLGKFYVKLSQRKNYGLWGNFKVGYMNNELAQVDRGLYGANVHYETAGNHELRRAAFCVLDAFAAEPGTVSEPPAVSRHRWVPVLPASQGSVDRFGASCASRCATGRPESSPVWST